MDLRKMGYGVLIGFIWLRGRDWWQVLVNTSMKLQVP
jgi:hypothetical protein